MAEMDLEQYDAPTRGGAGRVRPRAAGRAALRALVAKLAWTDLPLIYWTGRASPDGPIADAVQARLAGLPAGVCAIRVASAPSDEKRDAVRLARLAAVSVDDPVAVTSTTIARSVRALGDTRAFPKLLPATVGDAEAWRAGCESALRRARSAVDAAARGEAVAPNCLVLGRRTTAPSRHPLGWPTDVLAEAERRVGAARLLRLARTVPGAADAASAVRGRLLVAPALLGEFLDALPELLALHERLADEPVRRLRAVVTIQGEAITAALGDTTASGPILMLGHAPTRFDAQGESGCASGTRRASLTPSSGTTWLCCPGHRYAAGSRFEIRSSRGTGG